MATLNCTSLAELDGFDQYVLLLRNQTYFNRTLLSYCQSEICGAIWGVGNPDISGVGMTAGYFFETVLGFLLGVFNYCQGRLPNIFPGRWTDPMHDGLQAFFDSSVYFAISLELASIFILAERDYDISNNGFGAIEAQITWAVSIVCLLPLMYPLVLLPIRPGRSSNTGEETLQRNLRTILSGCALVLFIYPFLSQVIHNWSPSQLGTDNGPGGSTIINDTELSALTSTCFGDAEPLSYAELVVLAAFEMVASLVIFLFAAWTIARGCGCNSSAFFRVLPSPSTSDQIHQQKTVRREASSYWPIFSGVGQVILLLMPALLGTPLLWGIVRLRGVQKSMAAGTNSIYADNAWSFGQIVALVIFAPVPVGVLHSWYSGKRGARRSWEE